MKYLLTVLPIIILITNCTFAHQKNKIYHNKLNQCRVTKSYQDNYEPEVFQTTNNLLRTSGDVPAYCGQKVIIKGTLLDPKCVPISDAKVYLWQVGCDGKYPYKPLRSKVDKKKLNLSSNSTFQGSGVATTNNLGKFYFVTIMPQHINAKPYVNLRVELRDSQKLQTRLYFSNDKLGLNDEAIDPALSSSLDKAPIYHFEIVMPEEILKNY